MLLTANFMGDCFFFFPCCLFWSPIYLKLVIISKNYKFSLKMAWGGLSAPFGTILTIDYGFLLGNMFDIERRFILSDLDLNL